jgi:hypothetical protein
MYNSGNSSKNVTGASIVDGTVETVDIADDAVTADKLANTVNTDIATGVSGSTTAGDALPKAGGTMTGTIAGFESTGIDDNATGTKLTVADTGIDVTGTTTTGKIGVNIPADATVGFRAGWAASGATRPATIYSALIETNSSNDGLAILQNDDKLARIVFGSPTNNEGGQIRYYPSATAPYMALYTGGSERMRVLDSGGITFNGDTAAANALDDYEEGTWTPVFKGTSGSVGSSSTSQSGTSFYTKIGRQVYIECYIRWADLGSWTGVATVEGLPFAAASGSQASLSFGDKHYVDFKGGTNISGYIPGGTSLFYFLEVNSDTAVTYLDYTAFDNANNYIMVSGTYLT